MSTELEDNPVLDEAPPQWPPVAHVTRKDEPVREGMRALCGEKLMGVPLDWRTASKVCEKCMEIVARELGW